MKHFGMRVMMPSISIIICSRNPAEALSVKRNLLGTAEGPDGLEIMVIDNLEKNLGLCAVYNQGAAAAKAEIIVFMHEDVWMLERGWDAVLLKKFRELAEIQILGVAGSSAFFGGPYYSWVAAGIPYTFGKVVQLAEENGEEKCSFSLFNEREGDQEVVVLDGLWFAARKSLFEKVSFDEKTFPGFHFYDLDICMQALEHGKIYATTDIMVVHKSYGNLNKEWMESAKNFVQKWANKLPVKTLADPPPAKELFEAAYIDLRGRINVPKW